MEGEAMTELDAFLQAIVPRLEAADVALHNGDAGARLEMWSHCDPVTLFGAAFTASGWVEVGPIFDVLASRFTSCSSWHLSIIAAGVSGDLGYLVAIEKITASVANAPPAPYALRVTTIFRRENGDWRIVHRHGDPADAAAGDLVTRMHDSVCQ
jgi:ketosteroid isomerase-like protein